MCNTYFTLFPSYLNIFNTENFKVKSPLHNFTDPDPVKRIRFQSLNRKLHPLRHIEQDKSGLYYCARGRCDIRNQELGRCLIENDVIDWLYVKFSDMTTHNEKLCIFV